MLSASQGYRQPVDPPPRSRRIWLYLSVTEIHRRMIVIGDNLCVFIVRSAWKGGADHLELSLAPGLTKPVESGNEVL